MHMLCFAPADVDECSSASACGPNTICTNTNGSYACACTAGFALLEGKDIKVDGCAGEKADWWFSSDNVTSNLEM
jgi:hypothetical protein